MRSFRAFLRSHRWPALLALAIFLGGTNYCVAVAVAGPGARFACGMTAGTADHDAPPPCHGHAGKPRSEPAKRGPMPCCITLALSSAAPDAKPAVEVTLALPPGIELAPAPVSEWSETPEILDTGPPAAPAATHASRAPPLA